MTKIFEAKQPVRLLILLLSVLSLTGCGDGGRTGHWLPGSTGVAADTTRPFVASTIPANAATGVFTNSRITATFNEAMDPATIGNTTFTVVNTTLGGSAVAGSVTYAVAARTATFTPTTPALLPDNTLFTATITTGARDLAGNALAANFIWSFTTGAGGAALDNTAPTVTLTNPADNATGVATNSAVNATFSEAMDPSTITTATFTVRATGPPLGPVLAGTVSYLDNIATFTPTANLADNTSYTATIATGATDLAVPGNALVPGVVPNPWTFTTGTGTVLVPGAVPLGSVGIFGTFGGTAGMTNTGILTVINGSIGTTATGTSTVTGFHDTAGDIYTETPANIGAVNGTIYTCTNSTTGPTSAGPNAASCAIATQARLDAQAAYLALQALPPGINPGANLAGLTLAPGVYTAPGGSFLIEGGLDLTLDAQGDANAVWVFQMAGTLTVGGPGAAAPRSIILAGGAQAKNVFWAVGTFATINAAGGGTMVGTIISQAGASFSTVGNTTIVTLNGRVLSLGASVTLVDTVINVPAP